ncbi:MAG: threonylcarbamoyl-AMP synthase [Candidatus Thermoplasmatota archaeon]|nr:threonylcarbamoyl-AMP synthase [Candidatus Thermoplasmatota archaeon]
MTPADISEAIVAIQQGRVIIYPTDTLYGLGADIFNHNAVRTVFAIKHRPLDMPLSVAVSSVDDISTIACIPEYAQSLLTTFLPGSLTIILPKRGHIPESITGKETTIAIRVPNHPLAQHLLSSCGPLTATSANIHGQHTPSTIMGLKKQFGDAIAQYVDGGTLRGQPSTIVDLTTTQPKILREGTISTQAILEVISDE